MLACQLHCTINMERLIFRFIFVLALSGHINSARGSDCKSDLTMLTVRQEIVSKVLPADQIIETASSFHGTYRSAIKVLLETGFLPPGYTTRDTIPAHMSTLPAIYVVPIKGRYPSNLPTYNERAAWDEFTVSEGLEVAKGYAFFNFEKEKFLETFKIPVNSETFNYLIGVMENDLKVFSALRRKYGVDRATAVKAMRKMDKDQEVFKLRSKTGFVLVFDSELFKEFEAVKCGDEGIRIHVPKEGIPHRLIKQIIPLSEDDKKFLENPS